MLSIEGLWKRLPAHHLLGGTDRSQHQRELAQDRGEMSQKEGKSQKRVGGQRLHKLKSTLVRIHGRLCYITNKP